MENTSILTLVAAILLSLVALLMFVRSRRPAATADARNSPRTALLAAGLFAVAAAINWYLYFTRT